MEKPATKKAENETKPGNISSDEEGQSSLNHGNAHFRQDSRRLLSLFPPKVWTHVCGFLDSKDFLNLINSSLYFRELLLHKRVENLDKPVLKVLMANLGKNRYFDRERVDKIVLGCRTVCKSWKWIIDQEAWGLDNPEYPLEYNMVNSILTGKLSFEQSMEINQFLHHFTASHPPNVNPFPGKSIKLLATLEKEDFPHFCNSASALLQKYGQHVVKILIEIYSEYDDINPVEIRGRVVEWLNYMPNLQNLVFTCDIPVEDQPQMPVGPLRLNSLKTLGLTAIRKYTEEGFLPNCWSWMESYNLTNLVQLHENLESLKMTVFNKKDVEILGMVSSPLKSLVLEYYCHENEVKLSELFAMLSEKFSATLQSLKVELNLESPSGHLTIIRDSFRGRLNLPKVKLFEITSYGVLSLDFLLGMQDNLEQLYIGDSEAYWEFAADEKVEVGLIESNQIIKFVGYEFDMLKSNIWNLFPKLKTIDTFQATWSGKSGNFNRKDWIKIQKNNQMYYSGEISSEMEKPATKKAEKETKPDNISSDEEGQSSLNHGNARFRQDSRRLLSLFPPEVWTHVCGFLDSKDFLNLLNSSLYFRELFLHKRVEYLDKLVLKVLMANLEENRYFNQKIELGCRTVCKSWKSIIDQEDWGSDNPEHFLEHNMPTSIYFWDLCFAQSMEINHFLQHFTASHPPNVNPFPGKSILLGAILDEEDFPHFCNSASALLQKYGHHVVKIAILNSINPVEIRGRLVEWLNYMPNLQNLVITCDIPVEDQPQMPVGPLRLNSLKILGLTARKKDTKDRFLPNWSWMESYNLRNLVQLHENLESLKMTVFNKKDVEILGMVSSPLKSLVLQYYCHENEVKLSELFAMLSEKFSATLQSLKVELNLESPSGHLSIIRDSFSGRLNLPKVKLLDITSYYGVLSLDFLLGMQDNLEELFIGGSSREFAADEKVEVGLIESNQIIKFVGYEFDMLKSNIWNLFPKLKTISTFQTSRSMKSSNFNRKDWIQMQKNNQM